MDNDMNQDQLRAMAAELAKGIKTEKDLSSLTQQLVKLTVETALNAELESHLGYEKYAPEGKGTGNSRNGYSAKRLKGSHGEVAIETPRDRDGSFEPQIIRKGQTRLTQMDEQILTLYAKGLSTRDIVETFKEMYDADVSATLISKVTERVIDEVHAWQNRPLDSVYPIVYLDCIVLKIRHDKRVINKSMYLALGINMDAAKAVAWFEKAAAQDNASGQFNLGVMYAEGRGVRQDAAKAVAWLEKAAAQGYANAQYSLGVTYVDGRGVRQNKSIAKEWFGKACDNGDQDGCAAYRELNEAGY